MKALRTPDARFSALPAYSFTPHYLQVDDSEGGELRLHYVDEGPRNAAPVLLLHGEPSWSYLYRRMIPLLVAEGHRVIAPDLIGFGRSDKPAQRSDYSYARHVAWIQAVLEQLKLEKITLFCQDWGGLIGLRLVAENPQRFARVMAANTMLPTGDFHPGEAFLQWQKFSQETPIFPVGNIVQKGAVLPMRPDVVAAYDAPYPDESYKAGARQFPLLVPVTPDDPASAANRAAWEVLKKWKRPFMTAFSDKDPITRGADKVLQKLIPGCTGQRHVTVENGGHFLQEDQSGMLAQLLHDFIVRNPA